MTSQPISFVWKNLTLGWPRLCGILTTQMWQWTHSKLAVLVRCYEIILPYKDLKIGVYNNKNWNFHLHVISAVVLFLSMFKMWAKYQLLFGIYHLWGRGWRAKNDLCFKWLWSSLFLVRYFLYLHLSFLIVLVQLLFLYTAKYILFMWFSNTMFAYIHLRLMYLWLLQITLLYT